MASTIPKYEWTTHEVREWMADHFVTIMNRERSYAITIAQQYQGTGKQLFSNTKEDWLEVFERKVYGREMHDTMAGILRNDEELKKTGLPLQLLPLYQHRQIIEIVQGTFINQNSVRPPPSFMEDLGINGHAYLQFFLEICLTLLVSKYTSIGFSNFYFFLYALVILYYGSVRLSNYLKYRKEVKEVSNRVGDEEEGGDKAKRE